MSCLSATGADTLVITKANTAPARLPAPLSLIKSYRGGIPTGLAESCQFSISCSCKTFREKSTGSSRKWRPWNGRGWSSQTPLPPFFLVPFVFIIFVLVRRVKSWGFLSRHAHLKHRLRKKKKKLMCSMIIQRETRHLNGAVDPSAVWYRSPPSTSSFQSTKWNLPVSSSSNVATSQIQIQRRKWSGSTWPFRFPSPISTIRFQYFRFQIAFVGSWAFSVRCSCKKLATITK